MLQEICFGFYQNLYSDLLQALRLEVVANFLNLIPRCFNEMMNLTLSHLIASNKVLQSARKIACKRVPGLNNIVVEFFIHFWSLFNSQFKDLVQESITQGKLPAKMLKGLVVLLFKSKDKEIIGNFSLITLLNTMYKILAKLLQLKIQAMMAKIVH